MSEVKPHNTITNPVVLYNPKYAEIGQDILSLPWKDSGYYPHFVETNPTASATAEALNDAIEKIGVDTKQIGVFVCGGEGTVRLAGLAMRETVLHACTETVGIGWIGGGYASDFGKAHSGNKRLPPIEIVQKSRLRKGRSLVRSTVTLDGTKKMTKALCTWVLA